ncbi:unnamed protein product [Arabis nemorensis]|uniref:UBX domain-containing protein n=1 Tax=Arabis nemorensis TaxID=586526 RepID=A0A565C122_9BRAS|nr:unnamed protein product [Arabis nemorensis]
MGNPVTEISGKCGVSREKALYYLEGFNWDLNSAMEACRNQTLPPLTVEESSPSEAPSPRPRMSDSLRISNPTEEQSRSEPIPGTTPEAVGKFLDSGNSKGITIEGSSYSSRFDPTLSLNEALIGSSQVKNKNIQESTSPGTNQETSVCEGSTETVPMVMDSRRALNQLPSSREQPSQLYDKLIVSFMKFVGATREEAIACLNFCNGDVRLAVNYYRGLPSQSQFQASLDSPNQGYLKEGEIRSPSRIAKLPYLNLLFSPPFAYLYSSVIADPTETGSPFKEAGPGIATSQVVTEGVDEDSSTETGRDPLATQDRNIVEAEQITTEITFQVSMADGTEVSMTFKPDKTLRDIRNRIAELRPDDNRDYYLESMEGGERYDDLNTTVQRIYSRGKAKLIQVDL